MDLNYYSEEMDPKGFAENMANNCNGTENHEPNQGKSVEDEAPPSYADAFPPLPTTPNDSTEKSAVPPTKWGKPETKHVAKAKPMITYITQVRGAVEFIAWPTF